jgi:molecular chaperone GrpE (heat shock protein)
MDRVVRIPVKVVHSSDKETTPAVTETKPPPVAEHEMEGRRAEAQPVRSEQAADIEQARLEPERRDTSLQQGGVDWRDRALRLQAEMENFRRRQQRLAQEQAEAERERLLRAFLSVVDNVERALAAPVGHGEELRQGVQLTHRSALQMLEREGVEPILAQPALRSMAISAAQPRRAAPLPVTDASPRSEARRSVPTTEGRARQERARAVQRVNSSTRPGKKPSQR